MFRTTAYAAAVALALAAPATLAAQTCRGVASFANGTVQLGAGVHFADDVTSYGAGIGFGAENGGFAQGVIGRSENDDGSATSFGVGGGWQFPMGAAPTALQLCPVVDFGDADGEADVSATDFGVGLALGTALTSSQALSVVPFGGVSFRRFSLDAGAFDFDANYWALDLGVGFVANEWITIRPSVTLPFGEEDDFEVDSSFGVDFVFSFAKPGAR